MDLKKSMMDLKGKLALITGSTSGIGLSIAYALANAGSDIIITGLGDDKTICDITETIARDFKVKAKYIAADLQNLEEIKSLTLQILEHYPLGIDILINNAGIHDTHYVDELPDECWDAMIAVHLTAPFQLIKLLLPPMKQKGWGRIVNISSVLGRLSMPRRAAYTAAKHGLIGLTKGVALEVGKYGITCNAVCPGFVKTPLSAHAVEVMAKANNRTIAEQESEIFRNVATGKRILPQEVAEFVLFIVASGSSGQMTGSDYLIDGGFSAQ